MFSAHRIGGRECRVVVDIPRGLPSCPYVRGLESFNFYSFEF